MDLFKPITLEDQSLFNNIFAANSPTASEFTFPYLYMWRRDYNLTYAIIEGHLCLISESEALPPYAFCPIPIDGVRNDDNFKSALSKIEAFFNEKRIPLIFGRVEEKRLEEMRLVYGSRMTEEYLEYASDYVYEASRLITLSGRKLSSKRNHINKFLRQYGSYEYVPVDESNVDECMHIMDQWCVKNVDGCVVEKNPEPFACKELLENWSKFNLKGALIKVAGVYQAFTVGELLNPETAVIHLEKGSSEIHGIYTIINRDFCANEWKDVKYINREEDMGVEGLRKAKQSYKPDLRVNKYLVKVTH